MFVNLFPALQRQKAVNVYFSSKQLLPFGFARQYHFNNFQSTLETD